SAVRGRHRSRRSPGARACTADGAGSDSHASRRGRGRRTPAWPRRSRPPAPDDEPAAQAQAALTDILDPGVAPEQLLPLGWIAAPELADAAAQKATGLVPAGRDEAARGREHGAHVRAPERLPDPARNPELQARDRPARAHDPGELAERRAGV